MENEMMLESERLQIEQIRDLEMEELQVEEVDHDSSIDDSSAREGHGGFTYDTYLASLHTDIGEFEDNHDRLASSNGGGDILNLPMFYLEGIVLFPEAILPLTVFQPRFKAAVERAMNRIDSVCTIGVVRVHRCLNDATLHFATIGTTAEIQQCRQLEDGSLNVVTQGQQRFHLRRRWVDVEGVPWAEVQIIQEDMPLRTPKDAFGQLASVCNFQNHSYSHAILSVASLAKNHAYENVENDLECLSDTSTESDHSMTDMKVHRFSIDSCVRYGSIDDSMSSDDDLPCDLGNMLRISHPYNSGSSCKPYIHGKMSESDDGSGSDTGKESVQVREFVRGRKKAAVDESQWLRRAPRTFWPHWVYRMYDPYCLARRVADMWRQIIRVPNMDDLVNKPDILSFHIASKIPVSESTRQELLEIDGVPYRLRREIELLEHFDLIRCKSCLTVIAKRSDMMAMSGGGPLNAYANLHGYVLEVMALYSTNGLALIGSPVEEHSWFPGYAWTITTCVNCESNMGWLFTATNKKLQPKSFWGIRHSQVADSMR